MGDKTHADVSKQPQKPQMGKKVLGKAKALSPEQQQAVIAYLDKHSNHAVRDVTMFLFTVKAGLRAGEVAQIEWHMVFDLDSNVGDLIDLPSHITKAKTGARKIPINNLLKMYLSKHHSNMIAWGASKPNNRIFYSERGYEFDRKKMASFFWRLYKKLGFYKCSSHSGRRTFITNTAREISKAGGSLGDVQNMVGHKSLKSTQEYIEINEAAKRKVVDLI
jgi:integrase